MYKDKNVVSISTNITGRVLRFRVVANTRISAGMCEGDSFEAAFKTGYNLVLNKLKSINTEFGLEVIEYKANISRTYKFMSMKINEIAVTATFKIIYRDSDLGYILSYSVVEQIINENNNCEEFKV